MEVAQVSLVHLSFLVCGTLFFPLRLPFNLGLNNGMELFLNHVLHCVPFYFLIPLKILQSLVSWAWKVTPLSLQMAEYLLQQLSSQPESETLLFLFFPFNLEFSLWNFIVLDFDFPVLSSELSPSLFLFSVYLVPVAPSTTSFSIYSMASVIVLLEGWKLILIKFLFHRAGIIWLRRLIRSPLVSGASESCPTKQSK